MKLNDIKIGQDYAVATYGSAHRGRNDSRLSEHLDRATALEVRVPRKTRGDWPYSGHMVNDGVRVQLWNKDGSKGNCPILTHAGIGCLWSEYQKMQKEWRSDERRGVRDGANVASQVARLQPLLVAVGAIEKPVYLKYEDSVVFRDRGLDILEKILTDYVARHGIFIKRKGVPVYCVKCGLPDIGDENDYPGLCQCKTKGGAA